MVNEGKDEEAIFNAAIQLRSSTERDAYLAEACRNDSKLRADVEALLRAHEAKSLLEVPIFEPEVTLDESPLTEGPGTVTGRYKLLEKIGEGGMAIVYMAEQEKPLRRRVALKIIKLGMDTKQVIARFEVERQALAMMDHPNIAKVFDAGATETGRPYFVMELVKGVAITEYCDKNKLSTQERLDLFIPVCSAIQHAHQKGIIHRDIKPSNVMVTLQDGKPVPKVIDFGVAKATNQRLTERTLFTRYAQMIGTPAYMSPEQAEMSGLDVDTRTDIYSSGVLLYELLTGALPFDPETLRSAALAEIQRIIREEEPPRPSTKLSSLGKEAQIVAQSRRTDVATLVKRLQRELEWIPLKAMRKDRTHRYRSASELADDIQNYLKGNPLIAGPESVSYQVKKFMRRNRALVTAVVAVLGALAVGLIVSTAMYIRAEQARAQEAAAHRASERANYFNRIALAEAQYSQNNVRRVRELLTSCPADMRGWEWGRLWLLSHREQMTLQGHRGTVHCVSVTPDGRHIVSGSEDETIKVWDMANGTEIMTLRGHSGPVLAVCVSPDGELIASGSEDKTVRLWDANSGAELVTLGGHDDEVSSVAFSPDSRQIASGSRDKTVRVWDTARPVKATAVLRHERPVYSVAFSPDGKRIAVSGGLTVTVWDGTQGTKIMTGRGHKVDVHSVCFVPSGERLVSGSGDGTVRIWNAATGAEIMTLGGHLPKFKDLNGSWYGDFGVNSVAVDAKGKYVISGGEDGTIKVWDAVDGTEEMTLCGHGSRVTCVAFSPDGERIISGSYDDTVKVWDITAGTELLLPRDRGQRRLLGLGRYPVAFSPDGGSIVLGCQDNTVRVWNAATGAEVLNLKAHEGHVHSVAFSPDGMRIVSGGDDKMVKVWGANSASEQMTLRGHKGAVGSVAFSHDGKRIVSSGEDGTVRVWDALDGTALVNAHVPLGWILAYSFSPDDRYIVSAGEDGVIRVWDAQTGSQTLALRGHPGEVLCAVFSPDGQRIVSGSWNGEVKLWDVTSGTEIMTLRGHGDSVGSVAFDQNGQRIVSGSWNGEVKLWDVASGTEIMTLRGHTALVTTATFSPDGKHILSADVNGMVKIWYAVSPEEVAAEM